MVKCKYIISLLIAINIISLVGCKDSSNEVNTQTQEKVIEEEFDFNKTITNANKIKVKEDIFNLNRVYEISVDDEVIGKINGQYINITGDIFTLTDKNDKEIASEKQIKRWGVKLNRLAEIYDADGNVSGYIGEEVLNDFFNLGRIMHFYDKDKNEIGKCEQKVFNYLDEYVVYNNDGNEDYRIKEQLTMVEPEYIIEVKDKESIVKQTDVVFATSIIDAIKQAEEAKAKKSKEKKK